MNFSTVGSATIAANCLATSSCNERSTLFAFDSNSPLNNPGNTKILFTWLGYFEEPVAISFAPDSFAKSGVISGTG